MMAFLRKLLRRVAAVVALVLGLAVAALFAGFTLAAVLAIGAALWLSARFGLSARRGPPGPASGRQPEVIDVEMREIGPETVRADADRGEVDRAAATHAEEDREAAARPADDGSRPP